MSSIFKIAPTIQQYDWGKRGKGSKVAQFAASSGLPGFTITPKAPYAELWMGTHPTSPSTLLDGEKLSTHLKKHPSQIGDGVLGKYEDASEGNLPFLFKVLSIKKALSIQSHPDKKTAEELHKAQPEIYKDPNHKPEMAIALTPFLALCGFRPMEELIEFVATVPELQAVLPQEICDDFIAIKPRTPPQEQKTLLKNLFAALMTAEKSLVKEKVKALMGRYERRVVSPDEKVVMDLGIRLNSQFEGDVGVFCVYLLNYVKLNPGQAIFLGAGEPHAYVNGDCIECMANSDNVIRAGLTPKLRDVPNLISGLTYTPASPSKHAVSPTPFSSTGHSKLYDPPVEEFSVVAVTLPKGAEETHRGVKGPSEIIVTKGKGVVEGEGESVEVGEGDVIFVAAEKGVKFVNAGEGEFVLYRAFVEA